MMKYKDGRKILEEPENVVLLVIVCLILGLLMYGETIVKIPRYYSVEITNNDGKKEWVFMEEGTIFDDEAAGEENEFWEPPCVAEDDNDAESDRVTVDIADDLGQSYAPLYDVQNDTEITQEIQGLLEIEDPEQT